MHKELNELKEFVGKNYGVIGCKDGILKRLDVVIGKLPKPKKDSADKPKPE
jgi:hypothetical protein